MNEAEGGGCASVGAEAGARGGGRARPEGRVGVGSGPKGGN